MKIFEVAFIRVVTSTMDYMTSFMVKGSVVVMSSYRLTLQMLFGFSIADGNYKVRGSFENQTVMGKTKTTS